MAAESKQENAIVVDHVKKHFKVFLDKGQSFKERLLFRKRRRYENRQVLRDISFTVTHLRCGRRKPERPPR